MHALNPYPKTGETTSTLTDLVATRSVWFYGFMVYSSGIRVSGKWDFVSRFPVVDELLGWVLRVSPGTPENQKRSK